jgi:hypothetical protein
MVSKNGRRAAAGHNRIDLAIFRNAEPIDPEHAREAREYAVYKRMDDAKNDGRFKGTPESPAGTPKNHPPLSEGDTSHPTKNKFSEMKEITGKVWK